MTEPILSFQGEHRFLSNFFQPAPVHLEHVPWLDHLAGHIAPSSEHAFQAAKTHDFDEQEWVLRSDTPAQAKRRGKHITLRNDWERIKLQVMFDVLRAKFIKGSDLAAALLATEDTHLEEGNHWCDTFWGVCHGSNKPGCTHTPANPQEENHLGKLLMQVRNELA